MKVKLRDLTEGQFDKWRFNECSDHDCEKCQFTHVRCYSSGESSWFNNKDLYSEKFLDKEIEIECEPFGEVKNAGKGKTLIISWYDDGYGGYSLAEFDGSKINIIHLSEEQERILKDNYGNSEISQNLKEFYERYKHIIICDNGSIEQMK